jgi:hypothetical protein
MKKSRIHPHALLLRESGLLLHLQLLPELIVHLLPELSVHLLPELLLQLLLHLGHSTFLLFQ